MSIFCDCWYYKYFNLGGPPSSSFQSQRVSKDHYKGLEKLIPIYYRFTPTLLLGGWGGTGSYLFTHSKKKSGLTWTSFGILFSSPQWTRQKNLFRNTLLSFFPVPVFSLRKFQKQPKMHISEKITNNRVARFINHVNSWTFHVRLLSLSCNGPRIIWLRLESLRHFYKMIQPLCALAASKK